MNNILKRKGGPIPKVIKEGIMKELTKLVQNGSTLGVTNQQLADRLGQQHNINIKVHTIGNYLKKVYDSLPMEDIQHTQVKLETMFNKVFRIVQEMIATAKTPQEKKNAVELLLKAIDKFTEFLESFGIKEKVADKVEMQGVIMHANIDLELESRKILEEI